MNQKNNRAHHSNHNDNRNNNSERSEAYDLGIHDYRPRNNTHEAHSRDDGSRRGESRRFDSRNGDSRNGSSRNGASRSIDSRNRNSRSTDSYDRASRRLNSHDNDSRRVGSHDSDSRRVRSHSNDSRRVSSHDAERDSRHSRSVSRSQKVQHSQSVSRSMDAHHATKAHHHHENGSQHKNDHSIGSEHSQNGAQKAASFSGSRFFFPAIIGLVILVLLGIGLLIANFVVPIKVTVNDQPVEISGFRTVANAVEASGVQSESGDLLAVDGSLLEEGAGEAYSVKIDGTQGASDTWLEDGDVIVIERGADKTEDFTIEEVPLQPSAEIQGVGAIHVIDNSASPGRQNAKTGKISGITTFEVIEEADDVICTRVNIDTGGEKVIALTFDDGPNTEYTPQILDILAANGASATFFTVGDRITGGAVEVVQRAYNEGHQISTHSWDHAAGSGTGTNLSFMSPEEQVDEIVKGYEIIAQTTGNPASTSIRAPGGNFPASVVANLADLVTYEIGWNIDSNDWRKPGAAAIESSILSADPGDIILMHDGGGDRSQTVAALSSALPILRERGYRFVTIDQLLEYL